MKKRLLQVIVLASCTRLTAQTGPPSPQTPTALNQTAEGLAISPQLTVPLDKLTPKQIEAMRKELLDWPNLTRYRDENAKLNPPKPGEHRVVFYGDSITDFWITRGSFFPGKPYLDRGISGQTTPQMLARFPQDVLALYPSVVVILGGINDIAGNTGPEPTQDIQNNIRAMVSLAKASHIRVVLCSLLPVATFPWNPGVDPRPRIEEFNAWLQKFAVEQHLIYVDYHSALQNSEGGMRPELAQDKVVHPNAAGYAVMEPLAAAAIEKALRSPLP